MNLEILWEFQMEIPRSSSSSPATTTDGGKLVGRTDGRAMRSARDTCVRSRKGVGSEVHRRAR